jgi:putative ABC transport system permease protein
MKLFLFALKNAIRSWWRSIILGIFIFLIGFLTTFMGSFSLTIRNQMEDAIINGLSGHIQIRPGNAEEDDFAELMKSQWRGVAFLDTGRQTRIENALKPYKDSVTVTPRVRHAALFISDKDKASSLFIGLDPTDTNYQAALIPIAGRMPQPGHSHEIVLTQNLADTLGVKPGDVIGVLSRTREDYPVDQALTVVGVVQYRMLSLFSFSVVYMDIDTARELTGFYNGEVSDIILYLDRKDQTDSLFARLPSVLAGAGLSVVRGGAPQQEDADAVRLSTYKSMGGFFMGTISGMIMIFYFLIALLLIIVSILIANLVYMMGIERYREIGTLRAIGYSRFRTVRIFMNEIFCVTGFFGILGILAGTALNLYFSIAGMPSPSPAMDYIMGKSLKFQMDYSQVMLTLALIFGFTLAASFFPAFKACSLKPAETLKEA